MASSIASEFATRLRRARAESGLSQSQLAERTGISHSEIYRLEAGAREPRLRTIVELSRGLGIDSGALVVGIGMDGARQRRRTDGPAMPPPRTR